MKRLILLAACLMTTPNVFAAPALPSSTGTWKIIGDVQGTPINVVCTFVEADDHKLTGSCTAVDKVVRTITGTVAAEVVSWRFASDYGGSPITVTFTGTMDAAHAKMNGGIAVAPMDADGDFNATRQ